MTEYGARHHHSSMAPAPQSRNNTLKVMAQQTSHALGALYQLYKYYPL